MYKNSSSSNDEKDDSSSKNESSKDNSTSKNDNTSSSQKDDDKTESKPETDTSSAASSEDANHEDISDAPSGEMRAVWISYLDLEAIIKGKSASQAKAAINDAFDNAKAQSINTVIVQVRPFADALYESEYFPWSRIATGTQGQNPGYDPLEYMVSSAHSKGLEIHAWVNPYRILSSTDASKLSDDSIAKQWYEEGSDNVIAVDSKGLFFNPARSEVRELIVNGVKEIVKNYDVDGVHYDDYFYPTTSASFDKKAYNEYKASGGTLSQTNWRLENVNKLIRETYSAVKSVNSSVEFGVSPQANVDLNYSTQYADVKTWCANSGYIDYIMPQVYYGFENETCPYETTVKQWNSMIKTSGVKLYIGLAVYKIGTDDKWAGAGSKEWKNSDDILMRQVASAREYSKYGGFALYRYMSFVSPSSSVKQQVTQEMKNLKSIL